MMTTRLRSAVVATAFAAAMWPAGRVHATCTTSFADTTNIDCKAAAKCQLAISTAAQKYVTAVQQTITKLINKSQTGGLKAAAQYRCIGGPNDTKKCLAINGVCKKTTGSAAGRFCSADADCGGSAPAGACVRTVNTGCNTAVGDNTNECQVNQAKDPYAGAIVKAQTNLAKAINKACVTPAAPALAPVPAATVGITNIAACPGTATAADDASAYKALIDCIQQSIGGDFTTGNVVDANQLALQISTGSVGVNGGLPNNNKLNHAPRELFQLTGAQLLQIGTAVPSTSGVSPGGSLQVLNLAHCAGGNGNGFCINDADCGTDTSGAPGVCTGNTGTCDGTSPTNIGDGCTTADSATVCGAAGHCTVVSGQVPMTGQPVFNPADPNSLGPVLNLSASCAGTVATCLVTHTKNSGNGTTTSGSLNVTTGDYSAASPIVTDVFVASVAADCTTFRPCPVCNATTKLCDGEPGHFIPGIPCDAGDGSVTIECKPPGSTGIHVPNPFVLDTTPKSMLPAQPGNKFCGFCDTSGSNGCQGGDAMCANGCQTLTDCAGTGASVCDFSGTIAGFLGSTGTTLINAPGVPGEYEPVVSGIFCAGITNNGTVNTAAGLPGPVRVVLPYTLGYVVGSN